MKTLWYETPAEDWESGFPVGNGRLGAKVYGTPSHEVIQLNEESVWSTGFIKRYNTSSRPNLKEIRSLISKNRYGEAEKLAAEAMTSTPESQGVYVSAGEFVIDYYGNKKGQVLDNYDCYKRELDMESGVVTTTFLRESSRPSTADFSTNTTGSSISYTREVFASSPANVIVIHIAASTPKSISFKAHFNRPGLMTRAWTSCDDTVAFADDHGVPFVAMATAVTSGGSVLTRGGNIVVDAADEVTIYIDIQSAYRISSYANKAEKMKSESLFNRLTDMCLQNICYASNGEYDTLKKFHSDDCAFYFNKTKLSLTDAESNCSVNELLAKKGTAEYEETLWNYGKYLFISSTRKPGTLPALPCGLWSSNTNFTKGERYGLSGQTQMTYLMAGMLSMSNLELSLSNLLESMKKRGGRAARILYACDGYMTHSSTDLWGDSTPSGTDIQSSYWPMGAAWLATLVRDHYEYTLDKKYLKRNYKYLRDCCRFFAEYLVTAEDGKGVALSPSVALYNTFETKDGKYSISEGSSMDNRILEQLFSDAIKSAEDLGIHDNNSDVVLFRSIKQRLMPQNVSSDGKLAKWNDVEKRPSAEDTAYAGELYGLFPGHTITLTRTPSLAEAAKKTLSELQPGARVENKLYNLNQWINLHESEKAYSLLKDVYSSSEGMCVEEKCRCGRVRTMMPSGAVASMTRMIASSEMVDGKVEVELLPALPAEWKKGSAEGFKLKGNLRLDISWENGQICAAKISGPTSRMFVQELVIIYQNKRYEVVLDNGSIDVMNVLPTTV